MQPGVHIIGSRTPGEGTSTGNRDKSMRKLVYNVIVLLTTAFPSQTEGLLWNNLLGSHFPYSLHATFYISVQVHLLLALPPSPHGSHGKLNWWPIEGSFFSPLLMPPIEKHPSHINGIFPSLEEKFEGWWSSSIKQGGAKQFPSQCQQLEEWGFNNVLSSLLQFARWPHNPFILLS